VLETENREIYKLEEKLATVKWKGKIESGTRRKREL
jgi:hypothetical protein